MFKYHLAAQYIFIFLALLAGEVIDDVRNKDHVFIYPNNE